VSVNVSVIICCYTEERLQGIREAVASVQRQGRPPEEVILAVDNNPALYELLKAEHDGRLRIVLNDRARGLSATRNAGIAAARADLVAFLDDDAVAEPGWLANLVAPFDDTRVVGTGGRAVPDWIEGRPSWFPDELDWTVGGSFTWLPLRQAQVRNPHGHNMCFRRQALARVGLFDGSMGRVANGGQAGEEAELCLRLKRQAPEAKIIYQPFSLIRHRVPPVRGTWRYVVRRSYQEGLCKARIERMARAQGTKPLSTESVYLRHLLFRAVPSRLLRFWRPAALAQAVAIALCIVATGTGYLVGRWGDHSLSWREG
jgi:glycosyltransferase involved in cell wall biosynthesis